VAELFGLEPGLPPAPLPDKDTAIGMYRTMRRIRAFEDRLLEYFKQGRVPGTVHQYQGEEAVATGVCAHLSYTDLITSTHRPHGHAIAKGIPLRQIAAELYGSPEGCCHGYGGSMHLGSPDYGMPPASAIVAGGVPIAVGLGISQKLLRPGMAVAAFFGDGGFNNGAFHEGANMCAIWDLPVLLVCENNCYGASTHVCRVNKIAKLSERAKSYGMPTEIVDGNDVFAVYAAAGQALQRARNGEGPTFLECLTYRRCGHSRSDQNQYRDKDEQEFWMNRDPLVLARQRLVAEGLCDDAQLDVIDKISVAEVQDALDYAEVAPQPKPEAAIRFVYWEENGK
jgi:acetoin:2,6-dichlorophenolindophenol oxidoreductase subunit alpha